MKGSERERWGKREGFKKCSSLWPPLLASKWQTNGTAIWQEFSLLLPTFNRPWHEHDACPSGVAATFSSSICFMARNGDTVQPLVITAASYQPGSPGSQPASCSQPVASWLEREAEQDTRYKTAAVWWGGEVAQVKAHPGAGRQLGWVRPQPRRSSTNLVANHCHCHFANIFTPNATAQAATICLHAAARTQCTVEQGRGSTLVCNGYNCVQLPVRQVRCSHCAAAETRAQAGRECLARVACLERVTGSYLCCIHRDSLHPSLTTIASAILSALFKR